MKVSVIIPVYNAEKYLGVCLESVLIQTLQDFEIIVVDDCSTDSSPAIAESYLKKFGGRLKIITLPENTGSAAVPRNIGLEHARGKYIYFIDNDDLIIDIALETLYNFAEEYRADVVSMTKGFRCDEKPVPQKFTEHEWISVQDEIFLDDNFEDRLKKLYTSEYEFVPWSRFLRREFLIKNNITFPAMKIGDDLVWNFELIFTAKRWLRINTALYVQRYVPDSFSRRKRTPKDTIIFKMNPLINGLECLEKFLHGKEYFDQNPTMRLKVLGDFAVTIFGTMKEAMKNFSPPELYEIFLHEFTKAGSSQPALISCLMVMNAFYRNELKK